MKSSSVASVNFLLQFLTGASDVVSADGSMVVVPSIFSWLTAASVALWYSHVILISSYDDDRENSTILRICSVVRVGAVELLFGGPEKGRFAVVPTGISAMENGMNE